MAAPDLIVQVELPALGVHTLLKFGVRRASVERIMGALKDLFEGFAEDLGDELLLHDAQGTELKWKSLQHAATEQLAAWEAKLSEAQEAKSKGERAVHHMKGMREAYLKELTHCREQLFQKDRAEEQHQLFTPALVKHFNPAQYLVDDEMSEVLKQKIIALEGEHQSELAELRGRLAALAERLTVKEMHLSAKDKLLEQLRGRDHAQEAGEGRRHEEPCAGKVSTEDTVCSVAELLQRPARAPARVRDAAVGTEPAEQPAEPEAPRRPASCNAATQSDIDATLLERAMELCQARAELEWSALLRGVDAEEDCGSGSGEATPVPWASECSLPELGPVHFNPVARMVSVATQVEEGLLSVDGNSPSERALSAPLEARPEAQAADAQAVQAACVQHVQVRPPQSRRVEAMTVEELLSRHLGPGSGPASPPARGLCRPPSARAPAAHREGGALGAEPEAAPEPGSARHSKLEVSGRHSLAARAAPAAPPGRSSSRPGSRCGPAAGAEACEANEEALAAARAELEGQATPCRQSLGLRPAPARGGSSRPGSRCGSATGAEAGAEAAEEASRRARVPATDSSEPAAAARAKPKTIDLPALHLIDLPFMEASTKSYEAPRRDSSRHSKLAVRRPTAAEGLRALPGQAVVAGAEGRVARSTVELPDEHSVMIRISSPGGGVATFSAKRQLPPLVSGGAQH